MRLLRLSLWTAGSLLAAALVLSVALCTALWLVSARDDSLETALRLVDRVLPAGQTLTTRNVQGSLQEGGTVQWLRWQQGALSVEVHDLRVTWFTRDLLQKKLVVPKLAARLVHIEDHRPPPPNGPTPPVSLALPFQVDAHVSVETLEWNGAVKLAATELAGHYVFDSLSHSIDGGSGRIASGTYTVNASLGALAPMALQVQAQGTVQATLPRRKTPLELTANATLSGNLAGVDSRLALKAALNPTRPSTEGAVAVGRSAKVKEEPAKRAGDTQQGAQPPRLRSADKAKSESVQATLTADLSPWHKQPILQALATWQGLDPSTLWPEAPQAQLSGEATVTPDGPTWKARVQLRNAQPGPANTGRLPLDRMDTALRYGDGRWWIDTLQAQGAGGALQAKGEFNSAAAGWQGEATVTGVNPAAVDNRLAAGSVNGQLSAQQDGTAIVFKVALAGPASVGASSATVVPGATSKAITKASATRLKQLTVQGRWTAPELDIEALSLATDNAELNGSIRLNTAEQSGKGQLTLSAPGLAGSGSGHLSATQGEGNLQIKMLDAALAARWLASLPAAPAWLATTRLAGEGQLDASWTGGWKALPQPNVPGDLQLPAGDMRITAVAQVPRLLWTPAGAAAPWRLRDGRMALNGTPGALQLDVTGQAEQGTRQLQLQSTARITHTSAGPWQLAWNTAQLDLKDSANGGSSAGGGSSVGGGIAAWTLQLEAPVLSTLQISPATLRLDAGAGSLRLAGSATASPSSPPVSTTATPGGARIAWQPAYWERLGAGSTSPPMARSAWRSTGQVTGVPMAWLEALSPVPLTDIGLRGDVVLGGQWDARDEGELRLQAHLERTAGDMQLLAESDESTLLSAGVRVARLEVSTQGKELQANLRWESERAGQLQADFTTLLQVDAGAWSWPANAALAGHVTAQLPRVGAWSVLAPPGWRMRGTLDADATLGGTRLRPLWRGNLQAKGLAIRSVVDGIDFSRGTLRARLEDERLDIEEFTVQGAGAPQGGTLSANGFVLWQSPDGASTPVPLRERLRMEIDATATALRVSTRSDRRLAVSGKLTARLAKNQLALRGALTADQALFILPEDTAPRLGDDVRVHASAKPTTPTASASADATSGNATAAKPAQARPTTPLLLDVVVQLDLGKDFQVRGSGINTLLEGAVELRSGGRNSSAAFTPTLNGTLRTALGTYKAYGQQLDIEEGELRFTGPVNNPALNILAIRPNLTQRVGVQISGTALLPVVRLYADPDLAESEKLSWLVLGRSGANGGAEAAMLQQAAMALLGSKGGGVSTQIADAFGLDEISLRSGSNSDGSAPNSGGASNSLTSPNAAGATVTLGKRLSRDFYVAYERSLAGTLGTLSIFYDLSKRFTLRAQTGEQSAVDVIFTVRYD